MMIGVDWLPQMVHAARYGVQVRGKGPMASLVQRMRRLFGTVLPQKIQ